MFPHATVRTMYRGDPLMVFASSSLCKYCAKPKSVSKYNTSSYTFNMVQILTNRFDYFVFLSSDTDQGLLGCKSNWNGYFTSWCG